MKMHSTLRRLSGALLSLLLLVGAIPGSSLFAQTPPPPPVPTEDDLKREERDANYMAALQVANMEAQAQTQSKLRAEQERAASAMRQLYDGILEKERRDSGALTDDERSALALRSQMNGGAMVAPGQAQTFSQQPVVQTQSGQASKPSAEMAKALDTLAMEDGPEIARQKGLGFVPIGTIADVRLMTGVDTSIPGIVIGILVYDIWDVDTRVVVIPRGSKLIGQAGSMSSDTEGRGKVIFTMFVDPSGRVVPIATPVIASNRIGVAGVDGEVHYHWMRMLSSSIALAVISGYTGAGAQAPSSMNASNQDLVRQNMTSSLGQTSNQLLQRFAKIQPDITIEEGSIVKIILVTSIMAKPYRVVWK